MSWGTLQSLEQKKVFVQAMALGILSGVHQTLSGAQAKAPRELATLWFSQSHSTIIHWTVRCAPDYPMSQQSNGQLCPTVDCADDSTMNRAKVRTTKLECTGLSGAARGQRTSTVNCSKPQRSADVAHT
jgi:hypothetical protein